MYELFQLLISTSWFNWEDNHKSRPAKLGLQSPFWNHHTACDSSVRVQTHMLCGCTKACGGFTTKCSGASSHLQLRGQTATGRGAHRSAGGLRVHGCRLLLR